MGLTPSICACDHPMSRHGLDFGRCLECNCKAFALSESAPEFQKRVNRKGKRLLKPKRSYMLMDLASGNMIGASDDETEAMRDLLDILAEIHEEGGDITDVGLLESDAKGKTTRRIWPWPVEFST